jgi:hypothetical protein
MSDLLQLADSIQTSPEVCEMPKGDLIQTTAFRANRTPIVGAVSRLVFYYRVH